MLIRWLLRRGSTHPALWAPLLGGDFVPQFSAWICDVCTAIALSENPRDLPTSPFLRGTSSASPLF